MNYGFLHKGTTLSQKQIKFPSYAMPVCFASNKQCITFRFAVRSTGRQRVTVCRQPNSSFCSSIWSHLDVHYNYCLLDVKKYVQSTADTSDFVYMHLYVQLSIVIPAYLLLRFIIMQLFSSKRCRSAADFVMYSTDSYWLQLCTVLNHLALLAS